MTAVSDETGRNRKRDAYIGVLASLAAAISLLENTPRSKKAAASDKMFDQMVADYKKALDEGRAALSASPVARATMPRGGVETDWYAESIKLYRQNKTLRKALQEQHDWHLAQGEQEIEGVTLNMADEYGDSGMCERTTAALDAVLPSGIAGYERWKEQKASSVAQEPVAIKPLEWTSEPPYWVARVFGGLYSIERHEHGTELQGTFIRHLRCASVEAAKSAAQFDYEKRIRGALTIPPATPAGLGADEIRSACIEHASLNMTVEAAHQQADRITAAILALLSRNKSQS